jgi:hypothetical protein
MVTVRELLEWLREFDGEARVGIEDDGRTLAIVGGGYPPGTASLEIGRVLRGDEIRDAIDLDFPEGRETHENEAE